MRTDIFYLATLGLGLLFGGCASAPAPAPPAKPPPPAVVVGAPRFVHSAMDQLSFECGRAHAGVELRIALLDARGRELGQRDVRAGKAFARSPLRAGRVVRRRLQKERDVTLKVVGRKRPTARLRSRRLDAAELTAVKLIAGQSCRREEDATLTCGALADERIGRTLRLRRIGDPTRGTLEFAATFNRDFERGVVFEARLLDAKGRAHPRCHLKVIQPHVFETQRKRFRLVARAPAAVAALAAVKRLEVTGHHPLEALDGDQGAVQEVSLHCTPRPRIRPRATIH